jgi:hypothetical protein
MILGEPFFWGDEHGIKELFLFDWSCLLAGIDVKHSLFILQLQRITFPLEDITSFLGHSLLLLLRKGSYFSNYPCLSC